MKKSKKRVLIVDDEPNILELLEYNLIGNGFDVVKAEDGETALQIATSQNFDLILLDLMLPSKNGMDVCRELRTEHHNDTPIIMLTAKSEEVDKILGLEFGADDYVAKPFSVRELLARIKAVLRRTQAGEPQDKDESGTYKIHDLIIDTQRHEVTQANQSIELTLKEFELLKTLVKNKGKVMTREFLLDEIWGFDYFGETRTVDVHIRYLRRKLGDDEKYIQTIRGVGYKMM